MMKACSDAFVALLNFWWGWMFEFEPIEAMATYHDWRCGPQIAGW